MFNKKKDEVIPIDPLQVLFSGVDTAFRSIASIPVGRSSIEKSNTETSRAFLSSSNEKTYALFIHATSTQPCAAFFFPASLFEKVQGEPLASLETFGTSWSAGFPEPFSPLVSYGVSPEKEKTDASLWPFLEMEVYCLSWSGKKAFLYIDEKFRNALSSPPVTPTTSARGQTFTISRGQDFVALDALAPKMLTSGKNRFTVEKESFRFISGQEASIKLAAPDGKEESWYLASFELTKTGETTPVKISILYSFPKQKDETLANGLAGALFQESAKTFALTTGQKVTNPLIKKLINAPDLSKTGKLLTLRASIFGPSFRFPLTLAAPVAVLSPLFLSALDPSTMQRLSASPEALLFSLNTSLFTARFSQLLSPPELRKKYPLILIAELLNHLSDSDYDLVLQNCLIATLGAKGLPLVFYYNEVFTGEDGEEKERILALGPLDSRRLFQHMTEAFRSEYATNCAHVHENTIERCIEANTEAMKGIANTVSRKHIVSSARLSFLIRELFHKIIRKQFEETLKELKNKNYPFAALKELTPLQAQKALSKLDDKDAALVILDAKEERETLRRFVSAVRFVRLEEETVFLRRMYDAEELSPEELFRAKNMLAKACADVQVVAEKEKKL